MAKIKRIVIEFDDGTVTKLTRKQFIFLIKGISYGVARDAQELAYKRRKRKK